jgi:hypothetical protein
MENQKMKPRRAIRFRSKQVIIGVLENLHPLKEKSVQLNFVKNMMCR